MLNKLDDLKKLEQILLGLKAQMSLTVITMKEIDVVNINRFIKKASKEEIKAMKDINELLDNVDRLWNKTLL